MHGNSLVDTVLTLGMANETGVDLATVLEDAADDRA